MISNYDFVKMVKKGQIWHFKSNYNDFDFEVTDVRYPNIYWNVIHSVKGFYHINSRGNWKMPHLCNGLSWELLSDSCGSHTNNLEGTICSKCNMHNLYAEPNQNDGTYICYNCR